MKLPLFGIGKTIPPSWEVKLPDLKGRALALSRDSRLAAVGCKTGRVFLLRLDNGDLISVIQATHPNTGINSMQFGLDDKTVALGCGERFPTGTSSGLIVLSIDQGQKLVDLNAYEHTRFPKMWCGQIDFLQDGSVIALFFGAESYVLYVWSFEQLQEWSKLRHETDEKSAISSPRTSLLSGNARVQLIQKTKLKIAPSGRTAMVWDEMWDLTTTGPVVVYDPRFEDRIQSRFGCNNLRKILRNFPTNMTGSLAFPSDDAVIFADNPGNPRVVRFSLNSDKAVAFTAAFESERPISIRCSNDGRVIAFSAVSGGCYTLWSLHEDRLLRKLRPRSGAIDSRLFEISNNGHELIAANGDTVRLWRM